MGSELPFKLPVRLVAKPDAYQIESAEGWLLCETLVRKNADAIVAALNGYGAMREAAHAIVQAWTHDEIGQVDGDLIEALAAALNPPAAKEARDE